MNKKIFITLLTIFMVLIPQNIMADEIEETGLGNKDIRLYANVASTYTVKLPTEVDVTNLNTSFKISFKGDINSNEQIKLSMPNNVNLAQEKQFSTGHEVVNIKVEADKNSFTFIDLEKNLYIEDGESTVTLTHGTIPAGEWSVTLPITIQLTAREK